MLCVERAETTEAGVDHPELAGAVPRQLVDVDVAGDMNAAWQIAGIVLAWRLELFRHRRHVAVLPTVLAPPIVSRVGSATIPIGLENVRKWVLSLPLSFRTTMALPA